MVSTSTAPLAVLQIIDYHEVYHMKFWICRVNVAGHWDCRKFMFCLSSTATTWETKQSSVNRWEYGTMILHICWTLVSWLLRYPVRVRRRGNIKQSRFSWWNWPWNRTNSMGIYSMAFWPQMTSKIPYNDMILTELEWTKCKITVYNAVF